MGKGLGTSSSNEVINPEEQEVAPGNQNLRAAYPKDKLESKFFSSLECCHCCTVILKQCSNSMVGIWNNQRCGVTLLRKILKSNGFYPEIHREYIPPLLPLLTWFTAPYFPYDHCNQEFTYF